MATFPAAPKPDFPVIESIAWLTVTSELEGKMEQRRSKWTTGRRNFTLTWKVLNATDTAILWDFYVARKGAFESFTFVNPNDSVSYTCRFIEDTMTKTRFMAALYETGLTMIETNA